MNPESVTQEAAAARRFGWSSLCVWAATGLSLEAAQGWKLSSYLDDELTRQLLRLGHAHGALLSLMLLVYSSAGVPVLEQREDAGASVRKLLCAAALLIPVGFTLGAFGHSESDPGVGVLLVPVGALCLLAGLGQLALVSFRSR